MSGARGQGQNTYFYIVKTSIHDYQRAARWPCDLQLCVLVSPVTSAVMYFSLAIEPHGRESTKMREIKANFSNTS